MYTVTKILQTTTTKQSQNVHQHIFYFQWKGIPWENNKMIPYRSSVLTTQHVNELKEELQQTILKNNNPVVGVQ